MKMMSAENPNGGLAEDGVCLLYGLPIPAYLLPCRRRSDFPETGGRVRHPAT